MRSFNLATICVCRLRLLRFCTVQCIQMSRELTQKAENFSLIDWRFIHMYWMIVLFVFVDLFVYLFVCIYIYSICLAFRWCFIYMSDGVISLNYQLAAASKTNETIVSKKRARPQLGYSYLKKEDIMAFSDSD